MISLGDSKSVIIEYLKKANFEFEDNPSDPDMVAYQISFKPHQTDLKITIAMAKDSYRVDVLSNVRFSPIHINVLRKNPDNVISKMMHDIFMWMTPRDPQFVVFLNEKNDFKDSSYVVATPIYDGDLSFATLMKSIDKTVSGSLLTRRLIQIHMGKYTNEAKMLENEEEI